MNRFQLSQFKLQKVLYHDVRLKYGLGAQAAVVCIRDVIARYKAVQTQLAQKPYRYKDSDGHNWRRAAAVNLRKGAAKRAFEKRPAAGADQCQHSYCDLF